MSTTHWTLAERAAKMNPSVIREILKVTERPGIISFAGGLPSSKTFPVAEFEAACAKVLRDDPAGALQYAASEGYAPLREQVAAMRKGFAQSLSAAYDAAAKSSERFEGQELAAVPTDEIASYCHLWKVGQKVGQKNLFWKQRQKI